MQIHTLGLALVAVWLLEAGIQAAEPLRVLILSGKNVHDWKTTTPELQRIYAVSGRFKVVEVLNDPATCTAALLAKCDVVVCNWTAHPEMHGHPWGEGAEHAVAEFVRGGKGFVAFHAASTAYYDWPEFQQLVGLTWKWQFTSHTAYATLKVAIADSGHPITRGLSDFWITDELYQNMVTLNRTEHHVLCQAFARTDLGGTGKFEPLLLTTSLGQGRGLNLLLGHDVAAMRNVGFRTLLLRGTEWAASGQVTLPTPASWPATAAAAAVTELDPDTVLKAVAGYRFGQSRQALFELEQLVIDAHSSTGEAGVARRQQLARKTAACLGTNLAPEANGFLCRQLALLATEEQVPAVRPLLLEEATSDAARGVLESIPAPAAGQALRDALPQAKGRMRLGVINSLGNRAEPESVAVLIALLGDADEAAVTATAAALGKIGGGQAVRALEARLGQTSGPSHQAVADALLACAGDSAALDRRRAQESAPVRVAAFRRQVMSQPDRANALVTQALSGADLDQRTMALQLIREFPQLVKTRPLADQVAKLSADAAVLLLAALGDRGDKAALPAALQAASHEEARVRVAGLEAIGRLGGAANVPFLAQGACREAEAEKAAALRALSVVRGPEVNAAIAGLLEQPSAGLKAVALRSLAARDAKESLQAPLRAAQDTNDQVRIEAWQALTELAQEQALPTLVGLLLGAGNAERAASEQAVAALVRQIPLEHPRAAVVMAQWAAGNASAAKCSQARVLAAMGDESALAALRTVLKDPDPAVRETVIRAFGTWSTPAPLVDLRQLSQSEPDAGRRLLALRSFVRLASQAKAPPGEDMVDAIGDLLRLGSPPDDQKALLGLLAAQRTPHALQLGLTCLPEPALTDAAAQALVQIARSLVNSHKDQVRAAMRQVQAATKSPSILDQVSGVLHKADRPVNLALGATASSPDGLEPDGASGNDQAAIDGDPKTYWDETDDQPLYRFKVTFSQPTPVNALNLMGHAYQSHSPKDFDILCDDTVVKTVRNADYDKVTNEIFVRFPRTNCKSLELRITGYYGRSPGIRELELYDLPDRGTAPQAESKVAPTPVYAWRQDANSLALLNHDRVVWQLHCAKGVGKPAFHPVALTDGTELTWLNPPDHVWHRALWFSWKELNGVNYWEEDPKTGLAVGLTEVLEVKTLPRADFSARVEMTLSYHVAGQLAVLTETRALELSAPDAQGRYYLDWQSDFTAGPGEVLLKGGTAGGGYAGLSVRIAKSTRRWRVLDSEGRQDTATPGLAKNTHGQRSRWLDFGLVDSATEQPAGLAILDHPANPRHPSYWHIVVDEAQAFGYFSPALLWREPYRLAAGQSLQLRYRVLVHPGVFDQAQLEERWRAFAASTGASAR